MREHRLDYMAMVTDKKMNQTQKQRIEMELKEIKRAAITGILGDTTNAIDQKVMSEVQRKIQKDQIETKVDTGLNQCMHDRLHQKSEYASNGKSTVAKHLKRMEIKEIQKIQDEASKIIKKDQKMEL